MRFIVVGANHRDWPTGRVERFGERFEAAFMALVSAVRRRRERTRGPAEAVLLSTCHRFEIALYGDERLQAALRGALRAAGVPAKRILAREGREAALHVLRVAAGLDSVFPGEVMVMSQVKAAYARALAAGVTGPVTNRLFQRCLRACRSAREEIDGGADPRRLADAALRKVEALFPLEGVPAALIGSGPALAAIGKRLEAAGAARPLRVVRDHRGGEPGVHNLTTGRPHLPGCRLFVLDAGTLRHDLRLEELSAARDRFGEIAVLDFSLARGVDPACREMEGVYHFTRDELEPDDRLARERGDAERRAEAAVAAAGDDFLAWLADRDRDRLLAWFMEGVPAHAERAFEAAADPAEAARDLARRLSADLRRKTRRLADAAGLDLAALLSALDARHEGTV